MNFTDEENGLNSMQSSAILLHLCLCEARLNEMFIRKILKSPNYSDSIIETLKLSICTTIEFLGDNNIYKMQISAALGHNQIADFHGIASN